MSLVKSAKIYFFFAVLLFVAKPFLGFSMFSRVSPPGVENIYVKAFTKRKQEYVEGSNFDITAAQDKLADPLKQLVFRFCHFLNILFPTVFGSSHSLTDGFLERIAVKISPCRQTYLFNGKLII